MIVASNLCKRYPGGFDALRDVSFQIGAGQGQWAWGDGGLFIHK